MAQRPQTAIPLPAPLTSGRLSDRESRLKRKIAEIDGGKDRGLFLVHALAFPDISVHKLVLGPDAPPEIVADRNDLADMNAVIERVLAYHEGSRDKRIAPGPAGEAMLETLLAPTFRIEVPIATLVRRRGWVACEVPFVDPEVAAAEPDLTPWRCPT